MAKQKLKKLLLEAPMPIVFDIDLMKPACPLLQATLGGVPSLVSDFPSESWLIFPTPGMKVYVVTPYQLKQLIQKVVEAL